MMVSIVNTLTDLQIRWIHLTSLAVKLSDVMLLPESDNSAQKSCYHAIL